METYLLILISVISLLIAMWVPLTSGSSGLEAKRVLAWCAIVTGTLILPSVFLIWLVMQISARILAQTASDLSAFVSQIGWAIGASGVLYPLIWGVKFYPYFENYVSKFLLPLNNKK